jgi:hypothetical protein
MLSAVCRALVVWRAALNRNPWYDNMAAMCSWHLVVKKHPIRVSIEVLNLVVTCSAIELHAGWMQASRLHSTKCDH